MSSPSTSSADLKRKAISAATLSLLQVAGAHAIRLGGNLILTRLLFPEAFGMLSLVTTLLYGVSMLSDIGISDSIIRSPRGDEREFVDTAWTLQVIRGLIIFAGCCVLAYPFAWFYEAPDLVFLVQLSGIAIVIRGFTPVKLLSLGRHLKLARVAGLDLSSQVVGLACTTLLAAQFGATWTLPVGTMLATFVRVVGAMLFVPGPNGRFCLAPGPRKEISTYGRWIVVSSTLTFIAASSDTLIIGRLAGVEFLGVYGIAANLARAPGMALISVSDRVVFPLYSRLTSEGEALAEHFERVRQPLLVGAAATTAILMAVGDSLIQVLYDDRYQAGGSLIRVLALAGWIRIYCVTNESALKALGVPRAVATGTLARVLCLLICLPIAIRFGGVDTGIWVLVLADLLAAMLTTYAVVGTYHLARWRAPLPMTAGIVSSAYAASYLAEQIVQTNSSRLIVAGSIASLCWALPLAGLLRTLLRARAQRAETRKPA
ncbi:MAG: oligosaccharide flippase family protein [Nannocystaceae bacterium]